MLVVVVLNMPLAVFGIEQFVGVGGITNDAMRLLQKSAAPRFVSRESTKEFSNRQN